MYESFTVRDNKLLTLATIFSISHLSLPSESTISWCPVWGTSTNKHWQSKQWQACVQSASIWNSSLHWRTRGEIFVSVTELRTDLSSHQCSGFPATHSRNYEYSRELSEMSFLPFSLYDLAFALEYLMIGTNMLLHAFFLVRKTMSTFVQKNIQNTKQMLLTLA